MAEQLYGANRRRRADDTAHCIGSVAGDQRPSSELEIERIRN